MKKIILTAFIITATLSLSACGFTGGCDNLCGGSNLMFNYTPTTCCSTLPW